MTPFAASRRNRVDFLSDIGIVGVRRSDKAALQVGVQFRQDCRSFFIRRHGQQSLLNLYGYLVRSMSRDDDWAGGYRLRGGDYLEPVRLISLRRGQPDSSGIKLVADDFLGDRIVVVVMVI